MLNEKFKQVVCCFLLILFCSGNIFAQQEIMKLNKWITNWYLLGPLELEESLYEFNHLGGFENDFLAKYGGESNPKIELGGK